MMNSSISAMNDIYLGLEGAGLAPTREAKGLIVNISGKGGWGLTSVPKEIYEAVKAGATDPRPDYAGVVYDDVEQDGWPVNYIRNGEKFLAVNLEGIWAGDGKGGITAIPSVLDDIIDDHDPEEVKAVVETVKANLWRIR